MDNELINKIFNENKKQLISEFDWLVENEELINLRKIQLSYAVTPDLLLDLNGIGMDEIHIFSLMKDQINQHIFKEIKKELFKTTDYDYLNFMTCGGILSYEQSVMLGDKILENNYKSLITNGGLASDIQDNPLFDFKPLGGIRVNYGLYCVGRLKDCEICVDQYMKYDDERIFLFDEVQINICNFTFDDAKDHRYLINFNMDFKIGSSKLIYVLTDINSDNYKQIISDNRNSKLNEIGI